MRFRHLNLPQFSLLFLTAMGSAFAQNVRPFPADQASAEDLPARTYTTPPPAIRQTSHRPPAMMPIEESPKVAPLPLPVRQSGVSEISRRSESQAPRPSNSILGTVLVLASIVTVLFFGSRWLSKYSGLVPKGLPADAVEHLGRKVLEPRVSVHLVRCGTRLLILGVGPDGVRTLSEITEPVEVDLLAGACKRRDDNGSSFLTLFQQSGASEAAADTTKGPGNSPDRVATGAMRRTEATPPRTGGAHA